MYMSAMKTLIETAYNILNIELYLMGYHVTLWNVFLFSVVAYLLLYFIFRILK